MGGSNNLAVGYNAGSNVISGSGNVYVGANADGPGDESNTIRIADGLNFVAGAQCFIGGILTNGPLPIVAGTPVLTIDTTTGQLGWGGDFSSAKIAEQQKKIEQQQASIAELKSMVAQQQKGMEVLTAQLKEQAAQFTAKLQEQAAQIQKVSAQLEASKPAPQVADSNY
jgi:hypothetical protein